ncbi:hypothetical protein IWX90DRAFT_9930 [Phyllosticta citrichinensis]|uniref:Secreted protein n=1 Tax=Phyllosticta citrichinensis TaxID=1130410 RepID=A0ABR1Y689_9PEZI
MTPKGSWWSGYWSFSLFCFALFTSWAPPVGWPPLYCTKIIHISSDARKVGGTNTRLDLFVKPFSFFFVVVVAERARALFVFLIPAGRAVMFVVWRDLFFFWLCIALHRIA